MAVIWYDGFDHYGCLQDVGQPASQANMTSLYSNLNVVLDNRQARTGHNSCLMGTAKRSLGGDKTTVGIAMGVYMPSLPAFQGGSCFVQLQDDDGFGKLMLTCSTTGRLRIFMATTATPYGVSGETLVPDLQSTREMAPGTWNHLELWVTFDDSDGSVDVFLNGRSVISQSGINTNAATFHSPQPAAAQAAFGQYDSSHAGFPSFWMDDLVAMDDNAVAADGSTSPITGPTAKLGQYGVYFLKPTADTTDKDWQPSQGSSDFAMVDDNVPDADATFIFSSAANDLVRFPVEPLPANVTAVAAVTNMAMQRKTDTGDCDVSLGFKSGTDTVISASQPLTTSYSYYYDVYEFDPAGPGPFVPTGMPNIIAKRIA